MRGRNLDNPLFKSSEVVFSPQRQVQVEVPQPDRFSNPAKRSEDHSRTLSGINISSKISHDLEMNGHPQNLKESEQFQTKKEKLSRLFEQLDTNQDGYLSEFELTSFLHSHALSNRSSLNPDLVKVLFKKLD